MILGFIEHQEQLWLQRDFAGFYALAAPHAQFVDERKRADGTIERRVRSVAEDRQSAEQIFSRIPSFKETSTVDRIKIASDGLSAQVWGHERAVFTRGSVRKRLCAATRQTIVLQHGMLLSMGQTDRSEFCPASR